MKDKCWSRTETLEQPGTVLDRGAGWAPRRVGLREEVEKAGEMPASRAKGIACSELRRLKRAREPGQPECLPPKQTASTQLCGSK